MMHQTYTSPTTPTVKGLTWFLKNSIASRAEHSGTRIEQALVTIGARGREEKSFQTKVLDKYSIRTIDNADKLRVLY